MEDENFRKELEDLFRLFKRLVEKESLSDIEGVDPQQLEKLKGIMAQFDDVKDNLKVEIDKMDPFTKMMVSAVVKELRKQFGDEYGMLEDVEDTPRISAEEIVNQREELLKDVTDETARNRSLIETIDEQLRNPNLTDEEIDALLDKRTQISSKLA